MTDLFFLFRVHGLFDGFTFWYLDIMAFFFVAVFICLDLICNINLAFPVRFLGRLIVWNLLYIICRLIMAFLLGNFFTRGMGFIFTLCYVLAFLLWNIFTCFAITIAWLTFLSVFSFTDLFLLFGIPYDISFLFCKILPACKQFCNLVLLNRYKHLCRPFCIFVPFLQ